MKSERGRVPRAVKPAMSWKLVLGAFVVLLLGGLVMLAGDRTVPPPPVQADQPAENGASGSRSRARAGLPPSDPGDDTSAGTDQTTGGKEIASSGSGDPGPLDDDDGGTTGGEGLTDEEAETRARERYEAAQRNAYQFRKTDPSKVIPTPVMPALTEAAQKYDVPLEILVALMAVESGGAHRDADHSMEGGFGVMNLKENNLVDTLGEAAALLGREKEEVLYDQKLNIEAAAALLAHYYEDALAAGLSESEAWYMALSQYSGRPNPELAAALADEVAGMMMRGFETELNDGGGKVVLPPDPNPPFYPKNWKLAGVTPPPGLATGTDAPGAEGSNAASGGEPGGILKEWFGEKSEEEGEAKSGVAAANTQTSSTPSARP